MAAGDKLGVTKCDCLDGGTVEWSESKGGGASGKCLKCAEQRFKRSPNAVAGLKRVLAGSSTSSAAASTSTSSTSSAAPKRGLLDEFKS